LTAGDGPMGLSKRYIDTQERRYSVDFDALRRALEDAVPEALFAYVLGSASSQGVVPPHSDLDIAFFLAGERRPELSFYSRVVEACESVVGPVRCDLGVLNRAEPVYCFEALKGKLLFCRDRESWARFYSRACREYEHWLLHYEKQRRYRLERLR